MRDEEALLEKALRFDPNALRIIHQRYYESIYRYITFKVGDPQLGDDLTSEVFVRVLEALQKKQGWRTTPNAWIFGIARNVVAGHYRQRQKQPQVALDEAIPDDVEQTPAHQVIRNERQAQLQQALTKLTDDYRDVILLRYIEELSIRDSAEILDKTPGAIKGLQHRALRALHKLMHPFASQDLSEEGVS